MLRLASLYAMHKLGILNLKSLHKGTFNHFFSGLPANTVEQHATQFLAEKLPKYIYQPALLKLQEAKKNGYYTAILSSSPDFLVDKIADFFNVDFWDSTIYQKNKCNHFSHIAQLMDADLKVQTLMQMMKDLNLEQKDITVYTDSYLDLPLMKMAGQSVGVNPDRRLKAICQQSQWPVI